MSKIKRKKNNPDLTPKQADAVALLIAAQTERGMQAFVVAGAEVLEKEFGFTKEQTSKWATAAVILGGKYLRVSGNSDLPGGRVLNTNGRRV